MGADNTFGETDFNPKTKRLGYISIQGNKIVFVYHELPEPKKDDFKSQSEDTFYSCRFYWAEYDIAIKEYEASKRSVEVSNAFMDTDFYGKLINKPEIFKHNQPCEAEITGNKALITKIT